MSRGVAERFGANLSRLREQSGVTQEELAFRASLHRTEIGLLERGGRLPVSTPWRSLQGRSKSNRERCSRGSRGRPETSGAASSSPIRTLRSDRGQALQEACRSQPSSCRHRRRRDQ
ncbi:MAG: helix-turn-helix transcriptional regulator [Thermoleophilia bacterium]